MNVFVVVMLSLTSAARAAGPDFYFTNPATRQEAVLRLTPRNWLVMHALANDHRGLSGLIRSMVWHTQVFLGEGGHLVEQPVTHTTLLNLTEPTLAVRLRSGERLLMSLRPPHAARLQRPLEQRETDMRLALHRHDPRRVPLSTPGVELTLVPDVAAALARARLEPANACRLSSR